MPSAKEWCGCDNDNSVNRVDNMTSAFNDIMVFFLILFIFYVMSFEPGWKRTPNIVISSACCKPKAEKTLGLGEVFLEVRYYDTIATRIVSSRQVV